MTKNLLKGFCVFILLGVISVLYTTFASSTGIVDIDSLLSTRYINQGFVENFAKFFMTTLPFIITITLCSIRMSQKNERLFIRIIPFYLIFGILLNGLSTFINLNDVDETFKGLVSTVYTFISYTNYFLMPFLILNIINPNNQFAKVFKITGYVFIVVTIVCIIWLYIKIFMVEKLPNVYGYDGFNFTTVAETFKFTVNLTVFSVISEIFCIVLGYISNFAFESETIESDVLDYEELMAQADIVAKQKQEQLYNPTTKKEAEPKIDRSVSESSGLMNINNQLGSNSNVGVVKKDELGVNLIEKALPTNSAPVVNSTVVQKAPEPVTAPPTEPKTEVVVEDVNVLMQRQMAAQNTNPVEPPTN